MTFWPIRKRWAGGLGVPARGDDTSQPGDPASQMAMVRTARCIQTAVLASAGIVAPIFSSIEEYIGHNQQEYYNVLAEVGGGGWNPERSAKPWVRYCLKGHYLQAQTHLRRTRELARVYADLDDLAKARGLPERSAMALVQAAFGTRVRNFVLPRKRGDSPTISPAPERVGRCRIAHPERRKAWPPLRGVAGPDGDPAEGTPSQARLPIPFRRIVPFRFPVVRKTCSLQPFKVRIFGSLPLRNRSNPGPGEPVPVTRSPRSGHDLNMARAGPDR